MRKISLTRFAVPMAMMAIFGCNVPAEDTSLPDQGMQFPSMNRPDVRGINGAVVSDHP